MLVLNKIKNKHVKKIMSVARSNNGNVVGLNHNATPTPDYCVKIFFVLLLYK